MATWNDVHAYVQANYQYEDVADGLMKLGFTIDGDRSQTVYLLRSTLDSGEQWLSVQSPIGTVAEINLRAALTLVADLVVGGLSQVGDYLVLTNSVALENLDVNELVRPMELLTVSADQLERSLTGVDAH